MQLAEYVQGRRRIVAHVGPALTEAELGLVTEQARDLLEDAAQEVLDLGVEPSPAQGRADRPGCGRRRRGRTAHRDALARPAG